MAAKLPAGANYFQRNTLRMFAQYAPQPLRPTHLPHTP